MNRWWLVCLCLFFVLLSGCSSKDTGKAAENNDVSQIERSKEAIKNSSTKASAKRYDGEIIKDNNTSIIPKTIEIPAIHVKAPIEQVGTLKNGQMGVPEDFNAVGWYKDGSMPGERGSAVMAGHVDSKTGPAVFYKLEDLKKGDRIMITDEDDKQLTFEVVRIEAYPRKSAPLDKVFGFSYRKKLNLITCTGNFNRDVGTHEKRLVVYTELVNS
ncbi:class F sortase [Fictibacillus barbaricus]|uniref:LPXTG-site transpeptidase (Sortase) family protein n=1 Tax=Fictibacillus barbaricus TaxID=182136 RepID=A0ABU1TVL3_9BACL|nr:class F sortase [Fictibacillus barbaricus]MDR7071226.1 LPXTG-site transpeptidase (sortase) family protein [Fictibacillus barbaricus]